MQPSPDPDPDEDDDAPWDISPGEHPSLHSGRRDTRLRRVTHYLWNPAPVPRPMIDPDLDELTWPERSGEVICFALLSIEYWLSQGGVLREWLRLNLWLGVILTLVAVLLVPPITALLEGAAEWTSLGSVVVGNITTAVLKLPPIVLGIATLLLVIKLLQRHWIRHRRKGGRFREDSYEGYDGYR